jgi:hypothetical protein
VIQVFETTGEVRVAGAWAHRLGKLIDLEVGVFDDETQGRPHGHALAQARGNGDVISFNPLPPTATGATLSAP